MLSARTTDANFFALVHHVLEAQRTAGRHEDRQNERKPFSCLQHAAIYRDGILPTRHEFFPILCSDLSPNGLSFITNRDLDTSFVVLALGGKPHLFLTAEIVHRKTEQIAGQVVYRLGCQFAGRLNGLRLDLPAGAGLSGDRLSDALTLLDKPLTSYEGERRR